MSRLAGKRGLLTLAAALAAAAAFPAQAQQVWGFWGDGRDARLFYGVPESHEVTILFICEARPRKRMLIVDTVIPKNARRGQAMQLRLRTSAADLSYRGRIVLDQPDRTLHLEISGPVDQRIFALLRGGDALAIEAGGARKELSLAGVREPLARLERACGAGRPSGRSGAISPALDRRS